MLVPRIQEKNDWPIQHTGVYNSVHQVYNCFGLGHCLDFGAKSLTVSFDTDHLNYVKL